MFIDHTFPSANQNISLVHKRMRQYSTKLGNLLFEGEGISHQVVLEHNFISPGDLVLGADSHTCTLGAVCSMAVGVGSTDLALSLVSGKNWFRVPETIKIILWGEIPKGVYAKDIILYILKDFKSINANYCAIEFSGETIEKMDMDERLTLTNMVSELGAKCGFMPVDKKTRAYLKKIDIDMDMVTPDKDAKYILIKEYDISKLKPLVSLPSCPNNVVEIKEIEDKKIDMAFLGTCTNGRLRDLEIASQILKNKKVHPEVKFIVCPASKKIYLQALRCGIIQTLLEADCVVLNPGCGPCVGTHQGIPADGEVVISTANRNFKGRMGNNKAFIYLASPATVCASAIEGRICDPRKYL
jgi:3-isopropylmalate/(R)-2-methylmalate dehydratase large subunit